MDQNPRLAKVLLDVSEVSNDPKLGFEQKLHGILEKITQALGVERASVMMKKGRKGLEVVASTHPDLVGVRQDLDEESPSSWVARTGELLYVDDADRSERFRPRFSRYRKSAFLLVPVKGQGRVSGVISVTDKIEDDAFTPEEQEILIQLAGQVIHALENHRLAEDLRKKRQTLLKRNRQLKDLERLKTDLFRMLIHDLKGPISELMANLDILSYTTSDDNRGYVETAKTSCDTLYSMVSNLLDIARLEEGKLRLVYETLAPEDLLREAMARVYGSMEQKSLHVEEHFPSEDSVPFMGDRGILLRVLQNLLTNAVSYSPKGETIGLGFDFPRAGEIRFHVEDHGPGIPPEQQEAIFDKYAQLEKKGDGRIYTTGLGLTFCKLAVEAHRGFIRVESDGRHGSRFVFSLPLERGKRLRKPG